MDSIKGSLTNGDTRQQQSVAHYTRRHQASLISFIRSVFIPSRLRFTVLPVCQPVRLARRGGSSNLGTEDQKASTARRNIPLWSQSGMIAITARTGNKLGERRVMLYEIDPVKIVQLKSAENPVTYCLVCYFSLKSDATKAVIQKRKKEKKKKRKKSSFQLQAAFSNQIN